MENSKTTVSHTGFLIVLIVIILVVLLFPVSYALRDGGSMSYMSRLGIYEVRVWHQAHLGDEVDGVSYLYRPSKVRYRVGTTVTIFGFIVFDNTHLEPPSNENVQYEDEVRDLLDYYNVNKIDGVKITGVSVNDEDEPHKVNINFDGVKILDVSDDIVKLIRKYLKDDPECFINNGYQLTISTYCRELISKTDKMQTWKVYDSSYEIDPKDMHVKRLRLSSTMIPENVPSDREFTYVEQIDTDSYVTDDEMEILKKIYPDADCL